MQKQIKIRFAINTVEDLKFNNVHLENFFQLLIDLIDENHEIEFYRIDDEKDSLTIIKTLNHLENFKYSFGFINR